ncbi:MAG TPA: hypothetical protein VKV77_02320 [Methylovirgula sp.]|nr:hypothetical protein [Methylovirgula sp.]
MRATFIFAVLLTIISAAQVARGDESETDRLREALRDAIQQSRALQDELAGAQAQVASLTQQRDKLTRDVDTARARAKAMEKAYNTAVTEFNQHLEEHRQALEKWKAAYEDAADVARAKDAERAKFQAEDEAYKAADKVCEAKNVKLVKISSDILAGYRDLNMWKVLAVREPLIGIGAVDHENKVQAYLDRILDQKVQP